MKPINVFIDKDGVIYWDKFNLTPAPIPCPYSGRPCTGFCPHNYVFEGMNETVLGFTCGLKQSFDFEVDIKWDEKPSNIKYPYGVGCKHSENKEFMDARNNGTFEGSLRRYGK